MYAWSQDGILIFNTITARLNGSVDTWITGTGTKLYKDGHCNFTFHAKALQGGYYITIETSTGKQGEFQGATFNLPLEVAAAVRRIL